MRLSPKFLTTTSVFTNTVEGWGR